MEDERSAQERTNALFAPFAAGGTAGIATFLVILALAVFAEDRTPVSKMLLAGGYGLFNAGICIALIRWKRSPRP